MSFLSFENILDSRVELKQASFPETFRRHETEKIVNRRHESLIEEQKVKMML